MVLSTKETINLRESLKKADDKGLKNLRKNPLLSTEVKNYISMEIRSRGRKKFSKLRDMA